MTTHTGSEGSVAVGANTVAGLKSFSVNEQMSPIEDSEMSDSAKTFKAGPTEWDGQLECMWDETDTLGQEAMTIGASVTLNIYPEGATTGGQFGTGTALITSVPVAGEFQGMVTRSFSFKGTGALTWAAVSE